MARAPVQAAHAGEQPDLPPLELPLQRPVARAREPREHRTAAAVQHREAVEAEVEGSAVDLEAVREQGPREYAGEAATRVASGHGHHDHAPVRAPRSQALADEGRAGLHHRHEVGAIGDVQRRPGRGGAGGAQHALSIGPAEATGERPSARRLDTLEIGTHGRGIAREHGRRLRDRAQGRDLASEVRVDHRACQDHPGPGVVHGAPPRVVVLLAGEGARDAHEREACDQRGEQQPPAQRRAAAVGVLDVRGDGRRGRQAHGASRRLPGTGPGGRDGRARPERDASRTPAPKGQRE